MAAVIEPPTYHEGIATLLCVILCFILALVSIYLAVIEHPATWVSMVCASFFVAIIFGLKGWWFGLRHE